MKSLALIALAALLVSGIAQAQTSAPGYSAEVPGTEWLVTGSRSSAGATCTALRRDARVGLTAMGTSADAATEVLRVENAGKASDRFHATLNFDNGPQFSLTGVQADPTHAHLMHFLRDAAGFRHAITHSGRLTLRLDGRIIEMSLSQVDRALALRRTCMTQMTGQLANAASATPNDFSASVPGTPWTVVGTMNAGTGRQTFTCSTSMPGGLFNLSVSGNSSASMTEGIAVERRGRPGERFVGVLALDNSSFTVSGVQFVTNAGALGLEPRDTARFRDALGKASRMTLQGDGATREMSLTGMAAALRVRQTCVTRMTARANGGVTRR